MKNFFNELKPALVITRREVRDQFRDWRIIFPIFGLTIFFPFLMNFTTNQMLNFVQKYGANIIGERLVPFSMMIVGFFPISVSLVIALESFVGEKERNSIEPLLNSPLKDWQLYTGKLFASVVPPLVGSFLGILVYTLGLLVNKVPLPEVEMFLQIITLTIVQAIVMVSGAVVVSSQATSIRAANLLSSFIIIPFALLIQGESIVMFWGYETLWFVVLGLAVLAVLFMRVGLAHFQREELLGREIDVLNIRWALKFFWRSFTGQSKNVLQWYRFNVFLTIKKLRWSLLITLILVVAGVWIGTGLINQFGFTFESSNIQNMDESLTFLTEILPIGNIAPVMLIFWQNLRVVIIAMIMGMISFGVLGVFPLLLSVGVAGYLMALLQMNGMEVGVYLIGFILPHGIIEIPAIMIASAAVFQIGVMLATPDYKRTVGEVWLTAIADWFKVMVGLVIPMLLIAAFVEAWVTPRIALGLFY
ncbi:MAG: hypothetical protein CL609_21190 [Anaerolineaceae bacterium]|nr:hypothetical protein [Anaerolineaceae bacterium]